MSSIYGLQLFQKSTLTFYGATQQAGYDSLGNPILLRDRKITVVAQLDLDVGAQNDRQQEIDPTEDKSIIYTGHVVSIEGGNGSLPAIGTSGAGTINGQHGAVELLPIGQSSIGFATALFGKRIRVKFTTVTEYGRI